MEQPNNEIEPNQELEDGRINDPDKAEAMARFHNPRDFGGANDPAHLRETAASIRANNKDYDTEWMDQKAEAKEAIGGMLYEIDNSNLPSKTKEALKSLILHSDYTDNLNSEWLRSYWKEMK